MKTYVAEVIDGTPQMLRELKRNEPLPLGVILKIPTDHLTARVVCTIDFITHYGRKYSAELRDDPAPVVDPMLKFKPSVDETKPVDKMQEKIVAKKAASAKKAAPPKFKKKVPSKRT